MLQRNPPPQPETIANIYDLETQPEFTRYYFTAAIFPTKLTWIAVKNNGHCKSWPGIMERIARLYFPDISQVYSGHGKKMKAGIRTTKIR